MRMTQNNRCLERNISEEMHFSSLEWRSEIAFTNDEQLFFENLLREYTLPILESNSFNRIKELLDQLQETRHELMRLQREVITHTNRLNYLVQNVDEPKIERLYKQHHTALASKKDEILKVYKNIKKNLFSAVSQALKQQKMKRLIAS